MSIILQKPRFMLRNALVKATIRETEIAGKVAKPPAIYIL